MRDLELAVDNERTELISGNELRQQMEGMFEERHDATGETFIFTSNEAKDRFRQLKDSIKAVYRATSEDKHKFISGLSILEYSAVTGKTNGDTNALKSAHVGFALGLAGCDVAKNAASIVVLDDNFTSIFNAVRWGRNVFDNCRKFLQFQLVVNISCLWIVILGGSTLGLAPFTILQLLWINLVMDILAAIALASEAPMPNELRNERVNLRTDNLVSPYMWRSIYT
jgi:P-type E1-E2 ATPase